MKLAAHQPYYLPWAGYFSKMSMVDLFVFMDDVQFTHREYFNRARVLVQGVPKWLTVPVHGSKRKTLFETLLMTEGRSWLEAHFKTLKLNYSRALHGDEMLGYIEAILGAFSMMQTSPGWSPSLADLTIPMVNSLAQLLGIETCTINASRLEYEPALKSQRLINMCKAAGADTYVAGSGGSRNYLDRDLFRKHGIKIEWQTFSCGKYEQYKAEEFIPGLSIVDLIANCGIQYSRQYLKWWGHTYEEK